MLNNECGWKDGDRSAVVLEAKEKIRTGPGRKPAISFIVDYMDHDHPSRLPDGSLRSTWTGPDRDPKGSSNTRKWQALSWRCCCASGWSAPNILPSRANEI
jgi:hypothetical protein